jgi:hypothetical protein
MKLSKKLLRLLAIGIIFISALTALAYDQVDNSLSAEDRQYIPLYLKGITTLPKTPSYAQELDFIRAVQHSVLNVAPRNDGLPLDEPREPKDLYLARTGLCYDRSRVIEKILRYSGFQERHIFIYSTKATGSAAKSFITPGIPSHAVTEVLTQKGWLVVDSNDPWISTDMDNNPVPMEIVHASQEKSILINWNAKPPSIIYLEPFVFVYGLYSRHGRFYPPYNLIPDVNYGELAQNLP